MIQQLTRCMFTSAQVTASRSVRTGASQPHASYHSYSRASVPYPPSKHIPDQLPNRETKPPQKPGSALVATGAYDGTVRLWRRFTGELLTAVRVSPPTVVRPDALSHAHQGSTTLGVYVAGLTRGVSQLFAWPLCAPVGPGGLHQLAVF